MGKTYLARLLIVSVILTSIELTNQDAVKQNFELDENIVLEPVNSVKVSSGFSEFPRIALDSDHVCKGKHQMKAKMKTILLLVNRDA